MEMKIAICYYSAHHGNTRKVIQAIAQANDVDLFDISIQPKASLDQYDIIGFASGIYGFEFHESVIDYLRQYLPMGKKVFFIYTYGGLKGKGAKTIIKAAKAKQAVILGEFSCRGYNTFGPFKWIGGTGRGRPNNQDLEKASAFFENIKEK